MKVIITPGAKKDLKKLHKVSQIIVIEKLKKLEASTVGTDVEKLTGFKNAFRIRVGNYRIVYRILSRKIYIVLIGHRRNVYEKLKRLLG